jgi:fatty acid amide hydrolase 2
MAVAAPPRSLTERSATELAGAIRRGEVSSAEVVEAHIEALERFAPRINAVVANRYAEARQEAVAADDAIASAGDAELPPLLGVPCTIKESIAVAGMPNSAGVVARREHRSTETAPTAARLLDAGAILLGVTNTSELTLWVETDNRVYGRTNNPYDPARTAGGSSGGEGAAVGSGGSPIGLGADIGGSIRTPAFFNGVFGHKATPGVVPNTGQFPPATPGSSRLLATGPIARRAEDLMPVLRIIAGPDGQDEATRDIELGDPASVSLDGLSVLISEDASYRPASRELRAARERAAATLADGGARVQHVSMKSMRRAFELYVTALNEGAGEGTGVRSILTDSGADAPTIASFLRRGSPHTFPTRMLIALEILAARLPAGRTRRLLAQGRAFAEEVVATIGDGVLLHPPHPRVAPRHGTITLRPLAITPVVIFNLAGVPATQVPLGLNARGLPLGVQVAAGPDRDHVSIAVAIELERALGGWVPPPAPR